MELRGGGTSLDRLPGDLLQAVQPPRAEQQLRALRTKRPRRRCAKSTRRAGNQDPFGLK